MEIENLENVLVAGKILGILFVSDFLIRLCMLWNVLNEDEGADRICWVLVVAFFPFFGSAAYLVIWRAELERRRFKEGMN